MKDSKRGGNPALRALAFVGVTLLLVVFALAAALFIGTRGPRVTARAEIYEWAAERSLQGVAGIFLSAEEKAALAGGPGESDPTPDAEETDGQALITITETAPAPAETEAPEESEAPAETEAPEGGEEAA